MVKEMKKFLRFIWSIIEVVVIVYVIMMTSILLSKNKYGFTQFGNYTIDSIDLVEEKSIEGVKSGDLLIVKNGNNIEVGDMIYYYVVYNESYIIRSSYVVGIETDNYSEIYTIDENNNMTVAGNRVLGKEAAIKHHIGTVLNILQSRLGFLFLVLLPILVIFIYQIYELFVIFKYEKVEDIEEESNEKKFTME